MKNALFIAAALLLASFVAAAGRDFEKALAAIDKTTYPNASAVAVFDSSKIEVKESGLSLRTIRRLVKTLDEKGAARYRTVNFNYDPLSAYVEIKFAKIYRASGKVETLDSSRFYDYPAPARMIYWGMRRKTIDFGALEPGDAVEYEIFRKGFTYALLFDEDDEKFAPPMKGHFYDIIPFWSSIPVVEKVYRIAMPRDKPLQFEVYNGEVACYVHFPKSKIDDSKVVVNPSAEKKGLPAEETDFYWEKDKIVYCWSKKNVKPLKRLSGEVAASDVGTKVLVSTAQDWIAKAVWFNKVNEDFGSFESDEKIKKKTDEIIKGAKTELEKISRLTHWVAEEIRYSGLSMGKGEGYTLHKGTITFLDRCGVCKDKAGMLVTMLRAAGFEAYPAMTMAGSRIDKIPADQFNHSVAVAKLKSGNWILLDPTWVPGVRELWSSAEQQQQFLMGIPGGADLKTTPISPPENHRLKLTLNSKLNPDGSLSGKLKLEGEGQSDALLRRKFTRIRKSDWKNVLPEYFAKIFPKAAIKNEKLSDPYDIGDPFSIEAEYEIPDFAQAAGDRIIFVPLGAINPFDDYYTSFETKLDSTIAERKTPFRIRCSKLFEISEKITLPKGYAIASAPSFESVKAPFVEFEASYSKSATKLLFREKRVFGKRIYRADEWKDFKKALGQIAKAASAPAVLVKK